MFAGGPCARRGGPDTSMLAVLAVSAQWAVLAAAADEIDAELAATAAGLQVVTHVDPAAAHRHR